MTISESNLRLDDIHIDINLQPRINGLDAEHVRELQEVFDSCPPLVVVEQNGKYLLVDGFHRYAAAQNLELESVPVKVVDTPEDGDLFSLAFGLNAVHGRPLSLNDRRSYAARLLQQHPEWSDREIGRHCGLSQPTIAAVRDRLVDSAQIEQTDTRVGAGGYTYKVGTNSKQRQAGELPEESIAERLTNAISNHVTPEQRIQPRKIAHYLQRLAISLEDSNDLDGWNTSADAANACRVVLGDDKAKALADRIGGNCQDVLDVVVMLGYKDNA